MGREPVFGGPFRDCGFHGVDDGRYARRPERVERREFEYTPDYTGHVMLLDVASMSTLYVVYEDGAATALHFVPHFGPGKAIFQTELPAIKGHITAEFRDGDNGGRVARVLHEQDEVLVLNLSELARGAGTKLEGDWIRDLAKE